ncbi:MAG: LON peptidase substrate-binding domain-containing protein [Bdellovibrionales bacterium]|jgi:ATP-dependent Lon protease|nr:LON peptidase substrate-binding domain-containing protein [Bdellovibrionales bacterium]
MNESVEVSVFPLTRMTLFPTTTKPLNIFEPRYLQMVEDALASNGLIALAFAEPASPKAVEVGVAGRLRSIAGVGRVRLLERRDDGTLLILLEAIGKVLFETMIEDQGPYLRAQATWLQEEKTLASENIFILNRLTRDLEHWLQKHVTDEEAREQFLEKLETPEEKINAVCSLMVLDSDVQQELLELDSINERCALLAMSIESEGMAQ